MKPFPLMMIFSKRAGIPFSRWTCMRRLSDLPAKHCRNLFCPNVRPSVPWLMHFLPEQRASLVMRQRGGSS